MALDFQKVREQVTALGETASQREGRLKDIRQQARDILDGRAEDLEALRQKVGRCPAAKR
jgi:hypothetical protein